MKVKVFREDNLLWYLNIIAPDGELLFIGVRGYQTKKNAAAAGMRLLHGMQRAVVVL